MYQNTQSEITAINKTFQAYIFKCIFKFSLGIRKKKKISIEFYNLKKKVHQRLTLPVPHYIDLFFYIVIAIKRKPPTQRKNIPFFHCYLSF